MKRSMKRSLIAVAVCFAMSAAAQAQQGAAVETQRDANQQQRIAEAVRTGVRNYWYDNPPPGSKLAALVAAQRSGAAGSGTTVAGR